MRKVLAFLVLAFALVPILIIALVMGPSEKLCSPAVIEPVFRIGSKSSTQPDGGEGLARIFHTGFCPVRCAPLFSPIEKIKRIVV